MIGLMCLCEALACASGYCEGADTSPALAQAGIRLLPGDVMLSGAEARQRLLVQATGTDAVLGQVTEGAQFTTSDEKVVSIDGGWLVLTQLPGYLQSSRSIGSQSPDWSGPDHARARHHPCCSRHNSYLSPLCRAGFG